MKIAHKYPDLATIPPTVIRALVRTYLSELSRGETASEFQIWDAIDPRGDLSQSNRRVILAQLIGDRRVEHVRRRDHRFPDTWTDRYRLIEEQDQMQRRLFE